MTATLEFALPMQRPGGSGYEVTKASHCSAKTSLPVWSSVDWSAVGHEPALWPLRLPGWPSGGALSVAGRLNWLAFTLWVMYLRTHART